MHSSDVFIEMNCDHCILLYLDSNNKESFPTATKVTCIPYGLSHQNASAFPVMGSLHCQLDCSYPLRAQNTALKYF